MAFVKYTQCFAHTNINVMCVSGSAIRNWK